MDLPGFGIPRAEFFSLNHFKLGGPILGVAAPHPTSLKRTKAEKHRRNPHKLTFPIAGHDFDFIHFHHLGDLPEFHVIQYEGPNVVAKPVCVQRALWEKEGGEGGLRKRVLKGSFSKGSLDPPFFFLLRKKKTWMPENLHRCLGKGKSRKNTLVELGG